MRLYFESSLDFLWAQWGRVRAALKEPQGNIRPCPSLEWDYCIPGFDVVQEISYGALTIGRDLKHGPLFSRWSLYIYIYVYVYILRQS